MEKINKQRKLEDKMAAILQLTFWIEFPEWILSYLIQISLKYIPKVLIDNKWALVQIII